MRYWLLLKCILLWFILWFVYLLILYLISVIFIIWDLLRFYITRFDYLVFRNLRWLFNLWVNIIYRLFRWYFCILFCIDLIIIYFGLINYRLKSIILFSMVLMINSVIISLTEVENIRLFIDFNIYYLSLFLLTICYDFDLKFIFIQSGIVSFHLYLYFDIFSSF